MKTELNFLELHHLVKELQEIVGSRVQKIYEEDGLLICMHKSAVGKFFLRITDKAVWLAKEKGEAPEEVTYFCSSLRKRLVGKKITKIEQSGSERIVIFTLETQAEKFYLIAELFSNGNLILTNSDKKILAAKQERKWKDRTIRRGLVYKEPPVKCNLFKLGEGDIVNDEKKLAMLGFGQLLAREIIERGGDFKAYKKLMQENSKAMEYGDEISPIELKQHGKGKKAGSFSELIDARLTIKVDKKQVKVRSAFEKKRDKLKQVIDKQVLAMEKLERQSEEEHRKGELIYEHYQELQEIIDTLKKVVKEKPIKEIKKKLEGSKVKDINGKTKDIIVEL